MFVAAGLTLLAATVSRAQNAPNSCPPGTSTTDPARLSQDACQMSMDVFDLMAPQLGLALAGGNATLGRGGTLGGLGHFSIGLRVNVFQGDLPQVGDYPNPSVSGRVQRTGSNALPSKSQIVGLPTADAAVGIFRGVPLGLTNVGGIDLLATATYVPTLGDAGDDIQISPDRNLQLGYGVRVGLLQEAIFVPGISFTYLRRDLPATSLFGTASSFSVDITDAKVKTSAYRVVASKNLLMFGVAAGVGKDRYDETATVRATSGVFASPTVEFSEDITRTNYFLDLSLNLPIFKLIGEVGQVTGGSVETYNQLTNGSADKARTYGSLGFRLAL